MGDEGQLGHRALAGVAGGETTADEVGECLGQQLGPGRHHVASPGLHLAAVAEGETVGGAFEGLADDLAVLADERAGELERSAEPGGQPQGGALGAGALIDGQVLTARFRNVERAPESPAYRAWSSLMVGQTCSIRIASVPAWEPSLNCP